MEVNGSTIAPNKCWWYLTDYRWVRGRPKMIDASVGKKLLVRDKDLRMNKLTQLPPSTAKEMLGVFLAPDGNEKRALQHINNQVDLFYYLRRP